MKTLLASLIVSFGAIVATVPAQASPVSQSSASFAKSKTYGGFAPGTKFKLTVKHVLSQSASLDGVTGKAKIQKGVPKFKKGDKVTFKIGKKGQLTGDGFSIKFVSGSTNANAYVNKPTASKLNSQGATVFLDSDHKVTAADLVFINVKAAGFNTKTYTVTYVLE
jgi:hypothetical protein